MTIRKKLYLLSSGTQWRVQWENGGIESYHENKDEAMIAVRLLIGALPEGLCSQVLIQGKDGKWMTEWTYGQDPFPPKG